MDKPSADFKKKYLKYSDYKDEIWRKHKPERAKSDDGPEKKSGNLAGHKNRPGAHRRP